MCDVHWLENNGRPAASLNDLQAAAVRISENIEIPIEIVDTASKFDLWR